MFVFNFGVESLEQSVKLGWLIIFDFLGNSPLFPSRRPKSNAFYSVFIVRTVFQLLNCCFGDERKPTIVSLTDFQRVQMLRRPRVDFNWLSVSFFDYWLISMSGFLLFLHRINFCFKSHHFPNQRGGYTKKKKPPIRSPGLFEVTNFFIIV